MRATTTNTVNMKRQSEPGCGGPSVLAANAEELPRRQAVQRLENLRDERAQLLDAVRAGNRDHHTDAGRLKILLKLEIPVDRQECVEVLGRHQSQQFAVALGRPSHVDDVPHVVARQFVFEWPRNALIEKKPHALR